MSTRFPVGVLSRLDAYRKARAAETALRQQHGPRPHTSPERAAMDRCAASTDRAARRLAEALDAWVRSELAP